MKRIIIGAGLTGLGAALNLPARSTVVLEAEAQAGGVCRTTERGGFRFDTAGHFLHLRSNEVRALVEGLIPGVMQRHRRRAAIFVAGTYVPYPFQAHLGWLPAAMRDECVAGFTRAHESQDTTTSPANLQEWFLHHFGEGITRHFLAPQNRKTYCCDPAELDTAWASAYVPRPSLEQVVEGSARRRSESLGYNAEFWYPREGGIDVLPRAMAAQVSGLQLGCAAVGVDALRRRVTCAAGRVLAFDELVSTMPLPRLVAATRGLPPQIEAAARELRSVDVIDVRLGIAGAPRVAHHWIYLPDPRQPFGRIVIPSNVSPSAAPPGHCAIQLELNVPSGCAPPEPDLVAQGVALLREAGVIGASHRVVCSAIERIPCAYVLHDDARKFRLGRILAALKEHGIHSVGRYGGWGYGGMESAILEGMEVARRLSAPAPRETRSSGARVP